MRISSFKENLLPLSYHTQITVIKQHNFYIYFVGNRRRKLLRYHLNAAVTGYIYYCFIRSTYFCANCCRQAKSHSAETSGRNQRSWFGKFIILGSPHLILAYFSADYSVTFCQLINFFHNIGWLNLVGIPVIFKWIILLYFFNP